MSDTIDLNSYIVMVDPAVKYGGKDLLYVTYLHKYHLHLEYLFRLGNDAFNRGQQQDAFLKNADGSLYQGMPTTTCNIQSSYSFS